MRTANMRAILTLGISASGKSSWAQKLVLEKDAARLCGTTDEVWVQIELDKLRRDCQLDQRIDVGVSGVVWDKWDWKNEKVVLKTMWGWIKECNRFGHNIILSNTNLSASRREHTILRLETLGYTVEQKLFPVSLNDAIMRDRVRCNGVGESVIRDQYKLWVEQFGEVL